MDIMWGAILFWSAIGFAAGSGVTAAVMRRKTRTATNPDTVLRLESRIAELESDSRYAHEQLANLKQEREFLDALVRQPKTPEQ